MKKKVSKHRKQVSILFLKYFSLTITNTMECLAGIIHLAVSNKEKRHSWGCYAAFCARAIQENEDWIQVLAGLAPSSQTVGSLLGVIDEQAKSSP